MATIRLPDSQPCPPPVYSPLSSANRSAGRFAFLLPSDRFPDPRINASRLAAYLSPARGRSLATAFRSPATAALFRAPIPGLTLPAYRFAFQPDVSAARSAFCSAAVYGLHPSAAASSLRPVAASASCLTSGSTVSTPLQDVFASLRIKAFYRFCCPSTRLPNPPDLRSLPAAVSITSSASDHRSRSATFPVACCSSNL